MMVSEDVYVSRLIENETSFLLKSIDDEQERKLISQYINIEMGNE